MVCGTFQHAKNFSCLRFGTHRLQIFVSNITSRCISGARFNCFHRDSIANRNSSLDSSEITTSVSPAVVYEECDKSRRISSSVVVRLRSCQNLSRQKIIRRHEENNTYSNGREDEVLCSHGSPWRCRSHLCVARDVGVLGSGYRFFCDRKWKDSGSSSGSWKRRKGDV